MKRRREAQDGEREEDSGALLLRTFLSSVEETEPGGGGKLTHGTVGTTDGLFCFLLTSQASRQACPCGRVLGLEESKVKVKVVPYLSV